MAHTELPSSVPDSLPVEALRLPWSAKPDRLDKVLAAWMSDHSRARLQRWIADGHVLVNGEPASVRQRVGPGDELLVMPQPAPEDWAFVAEPVSFRVVAEQADWVVVDKPAGLVTHPGAGNWRGTLLNGLLYRYPELRELPRAGIVQRLDKDTSGILVVARREPARLHLVAQLQARSMLREYRALVQGWLAAATEIRAPIGRDPRVPVRMTTERPIAPRDAATHVHPLRYGRLEGHPVTLVRCRLETGRTHQIRVHLSSIGHPLVADPLYGGRAVSPPSRQWLHARLLAFDDPAGGGRPQFDSPLPEDLAASHALVDWEDA